METNSRQIQIGIIIVLFLSSLIMPIILLYPIQEMLYRPQEFYYFEPYFNAYVIFMAALFVMALILLINFLIIPKTKKNNNIQRGIVTAFFLIALGFITLSFNNYKLMDSEGIHVNQLFSLKADLVGWEEIVKVEQVNREKDGVTKPDRLVFTLQNGSTIEEPLTSKMMEAKNLFAVELNQHGITIENVYE
ncbi:hypothetical protein [Lysinibacillus sp. ZYM-1]|uniref:hypothetical protein n=1 Tax=Lysinibacillus sp. ZYM-1 TaxID=1681184 RepID=UPI000B2FD4C3|nr:hypothetical protein [Lysinibacillus sp. ZYM-1]